MPLLLPLACPAICAGPSAAPAHVPHLAPPFAPACPAHLPLGYGSSAAGFPARTEPVSRPRRRCAFPALPSCWSCWLLVPSLHVDPAISAAPAHVPHHATPFCSPSISGFSVPGASAAPVHVTRCPASPGQLLSGWRAWLPDCLSHPSGCRTRPPARSYFWHVRSGGTDPGPARGSYDASVISPSLSAGNYAPFTARQRPPQPTRSPPGRYSTQPVRPDPLPPRHFRRRPGPQRRRS